MDSAKRILLEEAGFKVGSVSEFLELSPEEEAIIEIKLALSAAVKRRRRQKRLSQVVLAERLRSSQARVAKIEAGDPSVSIDLLVRALLTTGATLSEIGGMVAAAPKPASAN